MDDDDIYYGYNGQPQEPPEWWKQRRNADLRSKRLALARKKGTHSKAEWLALVDVFNCCVICQKPYHDLIGGKPSKDHIFPIYAGGCDCIANLQPVCRSCNSGKTDAIDYRYAIRPDWAVRFTKRLEFGWT